ncbi:MAG: hypothetical protein KF860_14065 [Cyclobacteriaceae bacterium]|nr:hypothetical protein [Cyclobacteriaceae bacterium]
MDSENINDFVDRVYSNPTLTHPNLSTELWKHNLSDILVFRNIDNSISVGTLLYQYDKYRYKEILIDTIYDNIEAIFYRDVTGYYQGKELGLFLSETDGWGTCYHIKFYNTEELNLKTQALGLAADYAGSCEYLEQDGTKCLADYKNVAEFDFYESLEKYPNKLSAFLKDAPTKEEILNSDLFTPQLRNNLTEQKLGLIMSLINIKDMSLVNRSSISSCGRTAKFTVTLSDPNAPKLEYYTPDFLIWQLNDIIKR